MARLKYFMPAVNTGSHVADSRFQPSFKIKEDSVKKKMKERVCVFEMTKLQKRKIFPP